MCIFIYRLSAVLCKIMQVWAGLLSSLSNVNDWVGAKAAAVLKDRVAALARYDANVKARYPEADFGGEDGGVN